MTNDLLSTLLSLPLEREFEGWITERILEYFESANLVANVWAVSPLDERTWPADEHVWMPGKIFGLQFKRAYLADPLPGQLYSDFQRLYWPLEADPRQFRLIRKRPEIYYCLPTFTNRRWRKPSLHHCIMWRPTPRVQPARVWYDNDDKSISPWARNIERHENCYRWGNIVERIQQCTFGLKVGEKPSHPYLDGLRKELKQAHKESSIGNDEEAAKKPLIMVNVRMEVQNEDDEG